MNKTQKGFSALEVLLILVVMVVIGGIGWYALHTKHQTDKILSQANKISQSTPAKDQNSVLPKSSQKTLVVKEWGVEFPYGGPDTFTYVFKAQNNEAITISSKNLSDTYGCNNYGAGTIGRYTGDERAALGFGSSGETVSQAFVRYPGSYTKLGNYYFGFTHDQGECAPGEPIGAQNYANDTIKNAVAAVRTIN